MKRMVKSKYAVECTTCDTILLAYDVRLVDGGMHYCLVCAQKYHANKERRTYKAIQKLDIAWWRGWWRWPILESHFNTLKYHVVKLCLQLTTWLKNNQNNSNIK